MSELSRQSQYRIIRQCGIIVSWVSWNDLSSNLQIKTNLNIIYHRLQQREKLEKIDIHYFEAV